ncbi:MAG: cysteine desulfurase family protein [Chlamydiota bacterium]|nr:cysteine desulfurase family protein [Chlamydiota bacterium]
MTSPSFSSTWDEYIYLDNNATTPLDPLAIEAMYAHHLLPANPSSLHRFGQRAGQILQSARKKIGDILNLPPSSLTFTSGGTESLLSLLFGAARSSPQSTILTSTIEHAALYQGALQLKEEGYSVLMLSPKDGHMVSPEEVDALITKEVGSLFFSAVNGETGARLDLHGMADLALDHQIPLYLDGVAALGKEHIPSHPGIAGIAYSGHKFHGPKGLGLTYIHPHYPLPPLIVGGPQERGQRAGTENVMGAVGMAAALSQLSPEHPSHMESLRLLFEDELLLHFPHALIHGGSNRTVNVTNVAFPQADGEALLIALDIEGIAASHGSACQAGAREPSRVLLNMGIPRDQVQASIRFSLSRMNRRDEIYATIATLKRLIPS